MEAACLNQFHDILPGSSIADVYVDTPREHAEIAAIAARVVDESLTALTPQWHAETSVVAVNPTAFAGTLLAVLPAVPDGGNAFVDVRRGAELPTQSVDGGTLVELDAAGYGVVEIAQRGSREVLDASSDDTARASAHDGGFVLENAILRVELSADGEIVRLVDKECDRDVIRPGERANVFQALEDRPIEFDAWNIDLFIGDRQWGAEPAEQGAVVVEDGPLRAGVEFRRRLGASTITQRVLLARGDRRIDFVTSVDWQERHTMLKVAFPVDVLAQAATYEIQWGNVQRSTHTNSSWDWAQYETCAHKWVDLSEGDYGVSLLNDCKYGHDVKANVLRLTLLRATTSPDPDADRGRHEFTYSLFPHPGDWRSGTVAAAYRLNDTVIVRPVTADGGRAESPAVTPLVSVDRPNVVIETVKRAEDGNGIIVRLYEHHRSRGRVSLTTGFPLTHAERCNVLEEPAEDATCSLEDGVVSFDITPYQIVTLRLVPDAG